MKDEDAYPIDTVVRIKKTGLFALVKCRSFLRQEEDKHFLGYEAEIEGKQGRYYLSHQDVDLEVLPPGYNAGETRG